MKHFFNQLMAALLLLAALQPTAQADDAQKLFFHIPYFSPEYSACSSDVLTRLQTQFQEKKIPAEIWKKFSDSFYSRLNANDVLRPFVDGEDLFVGTNIRWISVEPACHNVLLHCAADKPDSCTEMATFANDQVLSPLFSRQGTIIAERETFAADVLNFGKTDFVITNDSGKSWNRIDLPVACGTQGFWCRLIAQSALQYTLISTQTNEGSSALFQDVAVHSTLDGGKTWSVSIEKWNGVHSPADISVQDDTAVAIPEASGEFLTISRHTISSKTTQVIDTLIPSAKWDTHYTSFVTGFNDGYLVRVDERAPGLKKNAALFLVGPEGQAPSSTLIWQSGSKPIADLQTSAAVIVVRTWDDQAMVLPRGRFREQLHYSLDGGTSWKDLDMPDALLGASMRLVDHQLWLFSTAEIQSLDLAHLNAH